jgi:hypothetical protein
MTNVNVGDVVFSYANGRIAHIGVASERATPSPKPDFGVETPWDSDGWLLPVIFSEVRAPIAPKDYLREIGPLLPAKHSPIRPDGNGNQGVYLGAISDDLGQLLMALSRTDLVLPSTIARDENLLEDLVRVEQDTDANPTDRIQLSRARIGQGLFRRRVLLREPACRITGVTSESFLRASHIKPWRESTNLQRLDGANGLMLAPHVDLLFDRHLISFEDDGLLLVSEKLNAGILSSWHITDSANTRPFSPEQCIYLEEHRRRLL